MLVPSVTRNLFSVGVYTDRGFRVSFEDETVEVSRGGVTEAMGAKQSNGLYRMLFRRPTSRTEANVTTLDLKTWHERLGHIHKRALTELVNRGLVSGVKMKNEDEFFYKACQFGKLYKLPF